MSKVIADARSAVADLPEGATLLVGGFGLCGIPEELIEAVRDLGRTGLTIVSNNAGTTQFGLVQLLRNKQVRKVMASYVGENDVFGWGNSLPSPSAWGPLYWAPTWNIAACEQPDPVADLVP